MVGPSFLLVVHQANCYCVFQPADGRTSGCAVPALLNEAIGGTSVSVDVVSVITLQVNQQAVSTYLPTNAASHLVTGHIVAVNTGIVEELVRGLAAERLRDVAGQRASEESRARKAAFCWVYVSAGPAGKDGTGGFGEVEWGFTGKTLVLARSLASQADSVATEAKFQLVVEVILVNTARACTSANTGLATSWTIRTQALRNNRIRPTWTCRDARPFVKERPRCTLYAVGLIETGLA